MRIQQFDYSVDLLQVILWKYDGANNLVDLLKAKQEWYDVNQTEFWQDWFDNVFNLLTANAFGLSVWCRILNVPFYIGQNPESPLKPNFGFNEYDPTYPDLLNTYLNFGNSNFSTKNTILSLTVEEQRFLLRLRYYQLSNRCAVTPVNEFLNYLLETSDIGYSGTIYMLDGLDMSIEYVFTAPNFPKNLFTIIKDLNAFPRLAGVKTNYFVESDTIFGFGEFNQNFNNGNFIDQTV